MEPILKTANRGILYLLCPMHSAHKIFFLFNWICGGGGREGRWVGTGHVKKITQQIQKVLMLPKIFPLGWSRTLGTMRCTEEKDKNCNIYSLFLSYLFPLHNA
jgi:hypothetical protein